ncbi:MAG TPA: MFS transporter [Trichocoleus sp.]|jgi:MFS family permease
MALALANDGKREPFITMVNYQDIRLNLKQFLPALQSRNYRLFFMGQLISMAGTFMTQVAIAWLVYQLSGSAMLLGIAGFLGQIPTFLFAPFAGVLADRWNRQRLLVTVQLIGMGLSVILTILTFLNQINIPVLIILYTLIGLMRGLDVPVRQSFVIEVVNKREHLSNAIALNSSLVNAARLVGPAIGGLLIAWAGAGFCFLLDSISYIASTCALLSMTIASKQITQTQSANFWRNLQDGFRYLSESATIRSILLLLAWVSFVGMSYQSLLPIFAVEVLQGGSETLGFLLAAVGMGALGAAIYCSSRRNIKGLDKLLLISPLILGISLILFSISRVLIVSLLLLVMIGWSSILQAIATNTLLQTFVDDSKRGRVMSFYTMSFMGMAPFGSLFAGNLASLIGAANTLMLSGFLCIGAAVAFRTRLNT